MKCKQDHLQEDLSTRQNRGISFCTYLCVLRPSMDNSALPSDGRMSVCWIGSCLCAVMSDVLCKGLRCDTSRYHLMTCHHHVKCGYPAWGLLHHLSGPSLPSVAVFSLLSN